VPALDRARLNRGQHYILRYRIVVATAVGWHLGWKGIVPVAPKVVGLHLVCIVASTPPVGKSLKSSVRGRGWGQGTSRLGVVPAGPAAGIGVPLASAAYAIVTVGATGHWRPVHFGALGDPWTLIKAEGRAYRAPFAASREHETLSATDARWPVAGVIDKTYAELYAEASASL
jgi:hypothetical protein